MDSRGYSFLQLFKAAYVTEHIYIYRFIYNFIQCIYIYTHLFS